MGIEPLPGEALDLCEANDISYVEGDIREADTWRHMEQALAGQAADLVLERGLAGINAIDFTTLRYVRWLSRIWSLTSDRDGFIALELPQENPDALRRAIPLITRSLVLDGVEADFATGVSYLDDE